MTDLTSKLNLHPQSKRPPPLCVYKDHCFTKQFCQNLIHKFDPLVESAEQFCERYDDRQNSRFVVFDQSLADEIYTILRQNEITIPTHLKEGDTVLNFAGLHNKIRFCKYVKGDHFGKHYDYITTVHNKLVSRFTVMIYLNQDFEGGETRFLQHDFPHDLNFEIHPKEGDCIVFSQEDNRLLHEGAKVVSGVKYLLRTDAIYSIQ